MALMDDAATTARLAGYSWGDIDNHVQDGAQTALAQGYSAPEINAHLGLGSSANLADRLTLNAAHTTNLSEENDPSGGLVDWAKPTDHPDVFAGPDENMRWEYANALNNGEVTKPQDFADAYAASVGNPDLAPAIAPHFPSPAELTDHAIAILGLDGTPVNPETVQTARENLITNFAETGQHPADALAVAKDDPDAAHWIGHEGPNPYQPTLADLSIPGRDPARSLTPEMVTLAASVVSVPAALGLTALGFMTLPSEIKAHDDKIAAMRTMEATPEEIAAEESKDPRLEALKAIALPLSLGVLGRVATVAPEVAGVIPKLLHDESGNLGSLFHGTPHLFHEAPEEGKPFGEFKLSAVGSGEGNQAYGHGLYLAENKDIAEHYQHTLSSGFAIEGKPYDTSDPLHVAALMARAGREEGAQALQDSIDLGMFASQSDHEALKILKSDQALPEITENSGHLYEAHLPDVGPEHFLDWDKPLSKQSPYVQAALEKAGHLAPEGKTPSEAISAREDPWQAMQVINNRKLTGKAFYDGLVEDRGDAAMVSKELSDAGIAGTRYLDASSRGDSVKYKGPTTEQQDRGVALFNKLGVSGRPTYKES
jgi:hypothetical protein